MQRAYEATACLTLQKAYDEYLRTGAFLQRPRKDVELFLFTNTVHLEGTNYFCVLGMRLLSTRNETTVFGITHDRHVMELHGTNVARIAKPSANVTD